MIAIIIFFIAIVTCFGMLAWKAWEIRTSRVAIEENSKIVLPDVPFRHVEKNMLYLAKHIIQSLLLVIVKYWFILTTKTKKWLADKWPKIHDYFKKKPLVSGEVKPLSFVKRAIIESKTKIRRVKEKVIREHE